MLLVFEILKFLIFIIQSRNYRIVKIVFNKSANKIIEEFSKKIVIKYRLSFLTKNLLLFKRNLIFLLILVEL